MNLSPSPTLLIANQDGGAVRGAIPEKIPIPIPIPGFIMDRKYGALEKKFYSTVTFICRIPVN